MTEMLQSFYSVEARYPRGYTYYLMAVDYFLAPPRQNIIAGNRENAETKAMLAVAVRQFLPETNIIFHDLAEIVSAVKIMPHIIEKVQGEQVTAYICENFACWAPINNLREFEYALEEI